MRIDKELKEIRVNLVKVYEDGCGMFNVHGGRRKVGNYDKFAREYLVWSCWNVLIDILIRHPDYKLEIEDNLGNSFSKELLRYFKDEIEDIRKTIINK